MLINNLINMETAIKQTVHLTTADFKEKVFNYENSREWKYEGTLPAIIDFYADWCQPCKMIAPVLEELASEYAGKIMVYKVNTEKEMELASVFGIQSIPTLLFIPREGQPQTAMGALPKQTFEKVIKDVLLKN
jgi:thioredoxin